MNDVIRVRPLLGRIKRLPKFLKINMQFAKNLPFIDRVKFCIRMSYLILR